MDQKKLERYVNCEYGGTDLLEMLTIFDEEIARLTQARALLASMNNAAITHPSAD